MAIESIEPRPQSSVELQLKWKPFAQLKQQLSARPSSRVFLADEDGVLVIRSEEAARPGA